MSLKKEDRPLQITLADGLSDFTIPVSSTPGGPMSVLPMKAGQKVDVVADDSADPGIGATLAQSLVNRGLASYVGNTDKVEPVEVILPDLPPATEGDADPDGAPIAPSVAAQSTASAASEGNGV